MVTNDYRISHAHDVNIGSHITFCCQSIAMLELQYQRTEISPRCIAKSNVNFLKTDFVNRLMTSRIFCICRPTLICPINFNMFNNVF